MQLGHVKIISGHTADYVTIRINQALDEGYVRDGALQIVPLHRLITASEHVQFTQMMVRARIPK